MFRTRINYVQSLQHLSIISDIMLFIFHRMSDTIVSIQHTAFIESAMKFIHISKEPYLILFTSGHAYLTLFMKGYEPFSSTNRNLTRKLAMFQI